MGVGRVIATVILIVGLLLIVTGRFLGSMATLSGGTSKRAYSREVMMLLGFALSVVAMGLFFATE